MNASGGPLFHYVAWRFNHRLWRGFKKEVELWLESWRPRSKHLLLVGPSAGYCLPRNFLLRFDSITCIDPDPLALHLFKRRYKNLNVRWIKAEAFSNSGKLEAATAMQIYKSFPNHALLLCNCLGQWPVIYQAQEEDLRKIIDEIRKIFPNGEWASFHDLYSADLVRRARQLPDVPKNIKTSVQQMQNWWKDLGAREIRDHLTSSLFSLSESKKSVPWLLTPKSVHLIEFVNGDKS